MFQKVFVGTKETNAFPTAKGDGKNSSLSTQNAKSPHTATQKAAARRPCAIFLPKKDNLRSIVEIVYGQFLP